MNWIELKALYQIYTQGSVKLNQTLLNSDEVKFLIDSVCVLEKGARELRAIDGFNDLYEKCYLGNYSIYLKFLTENNFLKPTLRMEEGDIKKLIEIDRDLKDGSLQEIRKQIIESEESLRGVSLMFFKNEKYLDNKNTLVEALKKILGVEQFANDKDQQYIYKLECHNPRLIVLCENLDFLKRPTRPRELGMELWYAGGKNVNKLEYADTRGLPVYYSCDWDFDGLFIIYPLVKEKIPSIQLLIPDGTPRDIKDSEHGSLWPDTLDVEEVFSDSIFTDIIYQLIEKNQWIIEESNRLDRMLGFKDSVS